MAPVTHTFEVQYNDHPTFIQWFFNGKPVADPGKCAVKCDDEMEFTFTYIGMLPGLTFVKGVLLTTNPLEPIEDGPFAGRQDAIRLDKNKIKLKLGEIAGDWFFSINFSVRSSASRISHRHVPDPELQVSTTR